MLILVRWENNMVTIKSLSTKIFEALRQMDDEATNLTPNGNPTGLNSYGYHVEANKSRNERRKTPRTEEEWSRRLATLLEPFIADVRTEVPYPSYALQQSRRRQRCDLVLTLSKRETLWLEIKGSWRNYWGGKDKKYRGYLLHPLVPNLDPKKHTVPLDLKKLSLLKLPEANYVAELLIGFELVDDPMDGEVDELIELANLSTWNSAYKSWISSQDPNLRNRCWFWWHST